MLRKFSLLLSGTMAYALAQWLVVVLIARISGVEAQGQYSYALALIAPLTMLARLNLRSVLITDYKMEFTFPDYLATRVVAATVPFIVLPLIIQLASKADTVAAIAVAVVLMKAVEAIGDICHGQMQWHGRYRQIALALILRAVGMVIAFGAAVVLAGNTIAGILLTSIFWTIILLRLEFPAAEADLMVAVCQGLRAVPRVVGKCWPLGITMSLGSLFSYVPVYVLAQSADIDAVGRYTAVSYLWMLGVLVATPLVQAASTRMSGLFHENRGRYVALMLGAVGAMAIGGAGLVVLARVLGDEIVLLLYGPEYAGLGGLLVVMTYGLVVHVILPLFGLNLTIARVFRLQLGMNVAAVGVIFWLSMLLIPVQGIEGAAWAFVYGSLFKLVLSGLLGFMVLRRPPGIGPEKINAKF